MKDIDNEVRGERGGRVKAVFDKVRDNPGPSIAIILFVVGLVVIASL